MNSAILTQYNFCPRRPYTVGIATSEGVRKARSVGIAASEGARKGGFKNNTRYHQVLRSALTLVPEREKKRRCRTYCSKTELSFQKTCVRDTISHFVFGMHSIPQAFTYSSIWVTRSLHQINSSTRYPKI
jgi:hypothetical protein